MGARGTRGTFARGRRGCRRGGAGGRNRRFRGQFQTNLAPAQQFHIDLRQQFRVEQRAMLGTVTAIDTITGAQGVKRVLRARMFQARDLYRIDHAREIDDRESGHRQLCIQKSEVETRIMRDQRRIAEEIEQFLRPRREQWLVGQKGFGQAVHPLRLGGHVALGVEIAVKGGAGRHPVHHFDASDFHQPIAGFGVQTSGFGVENNLSHGLCILLVFPFHKRVKT